MIWSVCSLNRSPAGTLLFVSGLVLMSVLSCTADRQSDSSDRSDQAETAQSSAERVQIESDSAVGLASSIYADPKGFFTITPPAGWRATEYPDDPRGKVAFFPPDSGAGLRVLVKAVDIPGLDALIGELREKEKLLKVDTHIRALVFKGYPAVQRTATVTLRGVTLRILWIDFILDGLAHNLQYSAVPEEFEDYRDLAWRSMQTYLPSQQHGLAPDATEHAAAKWIRLAEIAVEMGDLDVARQSVRTGLEVDPGNEELLRMQDSLTDD